MDSNKIQAFETYSNLLDKGNVYYTSLQKYPEGSKQRTIYDNMMKKPKNFNDYSKTKLKIIADKLESMAKAEAEKDKQILNNRNLGVPSINLNDLESVSKLIDAYNIMLQTKEVVKRHLTKLSSTENDSQKAYATIPSYIISYTQTALNQNIRQSIKKYIEDTVIPKLNANEKYTERKLLNELNVYLKKDLFNILKKSVNDAYDKIANSGDENEADENRSYKNLLSNLKAEAAKNHFLDQFMKIMEFTQDADITKFDKNAAITFKKGIKKITSDTILDIVNNQNNIVNLSSNTYQIGSIGEEVSTLFVNAQGGDLKAATVGSKNYKVDVVITTDNLINKVADTFTANLDNKSKLTRDNAITATQNLYNVIENLADDFIIYSNIKNYKIGKWFEGFSTGEGGYLSTWKENSLSIQDNNFLQMMINCLKGAVFENQKELKGNIRKELAQDFAAFLFDDVDKIGDEQKGKGKSLHVFYLSGVYVPLCYLLNLLAQAFRDAAGAEGSKSLLTNKYIQVKVQYGNIAFFEKNEMALNDIHSVEWDSSMWENQREIAMTSVSIKGRFLASFEDFIRDYKSNSSLFKN